MTNLDKVIEYLHYLLKDKIEAKGKKREEAIMLLNHKAALKAIVEQSAYFKELSLARMEDVHLMDNSLLISRSLCPLSFRTVEANDYRAALLLFYEQNNISAFKKMFLEQIEFAMKEYF